MYRRMRRIAMVLGTVLLFGACGMRHEGTEVPETTNTPSEYPVTTVVSTAEPTMKVAPTESRAQLSLAITYCPSSRLP